MTPRKLSIFGLSLLTIAFSTSSLNSRQTVSNTPTVSSDAFHFVPRVPPKKPAVTRISPNAKISHVVVKFIDTASVRLLSGNLVAKRNVSIAKADETLAPYLATRVRRLFDSRTVAQIDFQREVLQFKTGRQLADLNSYYRIDVTSPAEAEQLVNELNADSSVEIAYVAPEPEPAGTLGAAATTPDYQPFQDYRKLAPTGVDADYANGLIGGDGANVKIVDIEGNWNTSHEDLAKSVGGLIAGTPINDQGWLDHGTAVLGEMIATNNGFGVTGICPGANIGMVSIGTMSAAEAIYIAANNEQPGDLILVELHAPGPHYNFQTRTDQLGYVCMEYWPDAFDAAQYAWARGVTVIEAAGNGAENYDDTTIYGHLFDTTYRNSHAILAGAGYPAASPSDRQKLGFSNYGRRVNLQGYGLGVYTTGYGDLYNGGGNQNQYYTSSFSGTSSASPIVTGSVGCLQGYFKYNYGTYMTSDMIRTRLVATGSPQLGDTTKHIGPRPDLRAAITGLNPPPSLYTNPIYADTSLQQGTVATIPLWLHNRSASRSLAFSIVGNDSLAYKAAIANWLTTNPSSGTIGPADSVQLTLSIDASVIPMRVEQYKGVVEVHWGDISQPLDSLTMVPVFLVIPCNDTTYSAVSSMDAGGPVFNWISARTLGTKIPGSAYYGSIGTNFLDDGTAGPFPIGFTFPFYDSSYTQMFVGCNGGISFKDTNLNVGGYFSTFSVPGSPFTTLVAPFWSDLIFDTIAVPQSGIYIYRSATNDTTVIEWYRPANFINSDTQTDFELVLSPSGRMLFQYLQVTSSTLNQSAIIGVDEIECHALDYYNNGDNPAHMVTNNEAVMVSPGVVRQLVMAGNCDGIGPISSIISSPTVLSRYRTSRGILTATASSTSGTSRIWSTISFHWDRIRVTSGWSQ
jgi:hypothetical protein